MDSFKALVERANPGYNMNLFEKRGHEGETFVALMRAFPHELFEAAEKYGSIRKFIEDIMNGGTWYAKGGNKYTLVPDKPGFLGGFLTAASIVLGGVSTFVPVVAPFATAAAVGASAANTAAQKAVSDMPFQQQIVYDFLLKPLPGDILLTGRTDMPSGFYYLASTKEYLYTLDKNGIGIYDVKAVGNGLGSTDLKEPGQFDTSGLSRIYLNADGTFNSELSTFNSDAMAFDLSKFLDTAGKVVGTATNIYSQVSNSFLPTSGSTAVSSTLAPQTSQTAASGTVYSAPASTNAGGLSTPVMLAIGGGILLLFLSIFVLPNKK
ncbi:MULTISPECIES: hypothetical protein [unclassified Dysgonomonas]|uniref:hypothetical protein n=1 Tax=unclassified Dysgonomonas TaxID=2630389 RepID=UPI0025BBE010|nr:MULTISPECIES: hypothetical protein [unclassified Dysgonomonas]HMM02732.1 hypothetical protein [Dysgonomonas sp.]